LRIRVFSQRAFAGSLVGEREMREVTEREVREIGGHRQIEKSVHEPPYWFYHHRVLKKLVSDYLPQDANEYVTEVRMRCIIITHYICAGHSAEETCEYLREQGYSLIPNALYQVVKKLNDRAEEICQAFGIRPPDEKDKDVAVTGSDKRLRWLSFDRHQWERRFRMTKSRTPAAGQGRLTGIVDLAVDGDKEASKTLKLYNLLTQRCFRDLGALYNGKKVIEREPYVPFEGARKIFLRSAVGLQRK
jgi:hypothetical protein